MAGRIIDTLTQVLTITGSTTAQTIASSNIAGNTMNPKRCVRVTVAGTVTTTGLVALPVLTLKLVFGTQSLTFSSGLTLLNLLSGSDFYFVADIWAKGDAANQFCEMRLFENLTTAGTTKPWIKSGLFTQNLLATVPVSVTAQITSIAVGTVTITRQIATVELRG